LSEGAETATTRNVDVTVRLRTRRVEVELRAESSLDAVDSTVEALLGKMEAQTQKLLDADTQFGQGLVSEERIPAPQDAYSKMATDLGLRVDEIKAARVVGFRTDKPQILTTTKFSTPEKAALALFYSFEIGLDKSPISVEDGEEAFTMSRYTEPFASRILTNLKMSNKINRARYDKTHEIILTPSGVEDARDVLKAAIAGSAPKRRRKMSKT
jgi:hypothetical protein